MGNEIAIIVRRKYHFDNIREILEQNNLDHALYLVETERSHAKDAIIQLVETQLPQVVVCGETLSRTILDDVQSPVVPIHRGSIQFSRMIQQALSVADKVAVIWRRKSRDVDSARNAVALFSEHARLELYDSVHEVEDIAERLADEGIGALIGTSVVIEPAGRNNLFDFTIGYTEEDILDAVRIAEQTLRALTDKQQLVETLNAIQDKVNEGLISISENGCISLANALAAKILKYPQKKLLDLEIAGTPLWCKEVMLLLEEAKPFSDKILRIDDVSVVLSGQPISVQGQQRSSILMFNTVEHLQAMEQKVRSSMYARGLTASKTFHDIVGESPAIQRAIDTAKRYAATNATILVYGETGVGKELFVQGIHNASQRKGKPFVAINCAALPENLVESELFGYEKGAFTGALSSGKEGLFTKAHNGTIFLDEISEMPLHIQARLLRVLQEREVTPIGSNRAIPINVRVIAATNKNLPDMVRNHSFREDLFYRLNTLSLHIPNLSERRSDIPLLATEFIRTLKVPLNIEINKIEPDALALISTLDYPGNVRQLMNLVECTMVFCDDQIFSANAVSLAMQSQIPNSLTAIAESQNSYQAEVESFQAEQLRNVLVQCDGDRKQAAKRMNVSLSTLYRMIKKYNL